MDRKFKTRKARPLSLVSESTLTAQIRRKQYLAQPHPSPNKETSLPFSGQYQVRSTSVGDLSRRTSFSGQEGVRSTHIGSLLQKGYAYSEDGTGSVFPGSISLGSLNVKSVSDSSLQPIPCESLSSTSGFSRSYENLTEEPLPVLYGCEQCEAAVAEVYCNGSCNLLLCSHCKTHHEEKAGCVFVPTNIFSENPGKYRPHANYDYTAIPKVPMPHMDTRPVCSVCKRKQTRDLSIPRRHQTEPEKMFVLRVTREFGTSETFTDLPVPQNKDEGIVQQAIRQVQASRFKVESAEYMIESTISKCINRICRGHQQGEVRKQEAATKLDQTVDDICRKAKAAAAPVLAANRKKCQEHHAHAVDITEILKRIQELETQESNGEDIKDEMEEEKKLLQEKMSSCPTRPDRPTRPLQLNHRQIDQSELSSQPHALVGSFDPDESELVTWV